MNNKPFDQNKDDDRAMEGRVIQKDGSENTDASFHALGWATTPEGAMTDLEELIRIEVELAEQQAEGFATQDATFGIKAFQQLLVLYPDHSRTNAWKKRVEELTMK